MLIVIFDQMFPDEQLPPMGKGKLMVGVAGYAHVDGYGVCRDEVGRILRDSVGTVARNDYSSPNTLINAKSSEGVDVFAWVQNSWLEPVHGNVVTQSLFRGWTI